MLVEEKVRNHITKEVSGTRLMSSKAI